MTETTGLARGRTAPGPVRVANVAAKLLLLLFIAQVVIDPDFGNLEGKAPMARAVTYPLVAVAVPAYWWLRRRETPYPWGADLLITLIGFSDILGNRLDLFDAVVWFDDWMHFMNAVLLSAGVVLLTLDATARLGEVVERSIAVGLTVSLGWELFEYLSFMTTSPERRMAYTDTLADLSLGFLGAVVAAVAVHRLRRTRPLP